MIDRAPAKPALEQVERVAYVFRRSPFVTRTAEGLAGFLAGQGVLDLVEVLAPMLGAEQIDRVASRRIGGDELVGEPLDPPIDGFRRRNGEPCCRAGR